MVDPLTGIDTSYNYADGKNICYKVREGDELWAIATVNHNNVAKLKAWNKLKDYDIEVGQVLIVGHLS